MTKVSQIMREYFEEDTSSSNNHSFLMTENSRLPIVPNVITWKTVSDPERFMRRFEFSTRDRLIDFLGEILEMENEMQHNGRIAIDHLHVDIEVYTKSIDCITELDIDYTKNVDQIYEDVTHYGYTTEA